MKKLILLGIILGGLIFPISAFAEEIKNFNVEIEVQKDASALVVEKILYNFGSESRHGIFRHLPVTYGDESVYVPLHVLSVTDENGVAYEYKDSEDYYYKTLQIGDPDRTISGEHWYYITYTADSVVNGFYDHDEFYWNVTGTEWEVPIEKAEVYVSVPEGGVRHLKSTTCYSGYFGAEFQDCSADVIGDSKYSYSLLGPLPAYQGLTIVAGFEKGLVELPALINVEFEPYGAALYLDGEEIGWFSPMSLRLEVGTHKLEVKKFTYKPYEEFLVVTTGEMRTLKVSLERTAWGPFFDFYLPLLIVFCGSGLIFLLWWKYGRDEEGKGTIMPFYEPPDNLTPGEVGVLYDEKAHLHDISASLIGLAVKGYLKIEQKEKKKFLWGHDYDYSFVRLKKPKEGDLLTYEKQMYSAIFKTDKKDVVTLDSLKEKFYKDLQKIKENLYKAVIDKGFYKEAPDKVRSDYRAISFVVVIFSLVAALFSAVYAQSVWYLWAFLFLASQFFITSFYMPKRTREGKLAYEKVLGYKMFLDAAEKDRLKVLFSPKEYKEVFEKNLPYAIALGVEGSWISQFEGLYDTPPDWYSGTGTFNLHSFASDMSNFNHQSMRTFSSVPPGTSGSYGSGWSKGSSGWSGGSGFGGGFSGGGFGGGGGGSW